MSDITPEKVAATPPTPENVAEMLTSGDNDYHDGNYWHPSIGAAGNVVHIGITAYSEDGEKLPEQHFRAVVVEGETVPIVLEAPAELGMGWHDGGDMLALLDQGITIFPGGADEWVIPPSQAREMAAQLAAMADAREAAQAQTGGAQ
ncbi:hypothetical protein FXF51_05745 [Nonomuraea sp. PA05]|uniref:hypothetical protein n=1 Tax=Nonomuraea sp. PA05 TaxID=2604466 RepID=UPI0011D9256F|nr:hypothetical protein [Nonomuraea sp. PA05]TYB69663.1 hypothetical protein FXF51_05745 [Nonomuraea sp. PA05]